MASSNKVCCVCDKEDSSYKCPICRESYCSVACYKSHKATPCEAAKSEATTTNDSKCSSKTYEFPTEDTVAVEKLEQLKFSEDVKICLQNPHVRDIITAVATSNDPTSAVELAMREPIFVELANACLKVVERPDDKKPC